MCQTFLPNNQIHKKSDKPFKNNRIITNKWINASLLVNFGRKVENDVSFASNVNRDANDAIPVFPVIRMGSQKRSQFFLGQPLKIRHLDLTGTPDQVRQSGTLDSLCAHQVSGRPDRRT
jgi:hypothetical protein